MKLLKDNFDIRVTRTANYDLKCQKSCESKKKLVDRILTLKILHQLICAFCNMAVGIKCKVTHENQDHQRFVKAGALKSMNVEI